MGLNPEHTHPPVSADIADALVANHRAFLAFVERRVGSRAVAEDILQDAFVRGLAKLDGLRSDESAHAWFYRVLRNAVIDYRRRTAAADRKLEAFAGELERNDTSDEELSGVVCACVGKLARAMKPEYARALQRVEVDGLSVKDFAAETGISESNAGVRVFRARAALREQVARSCGTCAEHGCLDCSCGSTGGGPR